VYNLDFSTIIQIMQVHQQTGLLHAEVPAKVAGAGGACYIEVSVITGTITSCAATYTNGRQLLEKEAFHEITRLGRLRWTFTPRMEAAATQPASNTYSLAEAHSPSLPQRIASLVPQEMRSWPRIHRLVFALADGTKSSEKIAEILSISPDIINEVLYDLQERQLIVMEIWHKT
jgi:hypothetical protein